MPSNSKTATENHMHHQGLVVFHAWPWLLSLPYCPTFFHDLKGKGDHVEKERFDYQWLGKDHESASSLQIMDEALWNYISTTLVSGADDDMVLCGYKWSTCPMFSPRHERELEKRDWLLMCKQAAL